ncbi:MAG: hypothetical protein WC612_02195 [Bdellovibrionales bacterium]|jgi:hypothetical protein
MMLSKNTASVLIDMIENRLAMIQISDREELREVMTLQRCLSEINGLMTTSREPHAHEDETIPTRGRRRKFESLMEDFAHQNQEMRQQA